MEFLALIGFPVDINLKRALNTYHEPKVVNKTVFASIRIQVYFNVMQPNRVANYNIIRCVINVQSRN